MKKKVQESEKYSKYEKNQITQKIIQKEQVKSYFNKTFNCLIKHINGVAVGLTDGGREIYIPNYKFRNENYFVDVKVDGIRHHKLSGVIK